MERIKREKQKRSHGKNSGFEFLVNLSTFVKKNKCIPSVLQKHAAHTKCDLKGLGGVPNEPVQILRAGSDLDTARKVVNSYPDPACQFAKPVWVCPACQVVKPWFSRTLTPKTVNVFLAY